MYISVSPSIAKMFKCSPRSRYLPGGVDAGIVKFIYGWVVSMFRIEIERVTYHVCVTVSVDIPMDAIRGADSSNFEPKTQSEFPEHHERSRETDQSPSPV